MKKIIVEELKLMVSVLIIVGVLALVLNLAYMSIKTSAESGDNNVELIKKINYKYFE